MKCVICKSGQTQSGVVTVTLNRHESVVIFKGVPAEVCQICGEYYLSSEVTEELLQKAESAIASGAEVEICRYAA